MTSFYLTLSHIVPGLRTISSHTIGSPAVWAAWLVRRVGMSPSRDSSALLVLEVGQEYRYFWLYENFIQRCNMSKTAVGLFEHPGVADQVVHDLDARAFPRNEIRILGEPREMSGDGVTSIPRTDFEVGLNRELKAIGASDREGELSSFPIGRDDGLHTESQVDQQSSYGISTALHLCHRLRSGIAARAGDSGV